MKKEEIKTMVRLGYAQVAKGGGSCCGPQNSGCCGIDVTKEIGKGIGSVSYTHLTLPTNREV